MKKISEIRNEKAVYFVCVNGQMDFESNSIVECKNYLCDLLKTYKHEHIEIGFPYEYYIGMYSITIE